MSRAYTLLFICYCTHFSLAQNCFNADLETGNLDGFTAYAGEITETGEVVMDTQGIIPLRHDLVHISEGFDTVALRYCVTNRLLPVVPKDGGQYTLRLGNSLVGAEAEMVVFPLTVTADMPFFQLRYAVVLNDPHHHEFEQPRFELRILDESNTVIPCGEYKVKAAPEIPEFESCGGGWRVRPWTTVGFDLQPYIGQTLQIEFLTTDCSQGGHAGYAYLEASCNPFEMVVKEYCPETAMTTASVTDGYLSYEWNTGETGTSINIPNPQEHTEYTVTITSNTGCSFVMKDTLTFSYPPKFLPEKDQTFCRDTQFLFTPKGGYLETIYSPILDTHAHTFLIGNDQPQHTFIASNFNNCYHDTLSFKLAKAPLPITATTDTLTCFEDQNGVLSVSSETDFPPLKYRWSNGATAAALTNLSAGNYIVTITDAIHCAVTKALTISAPPPLHLNAMEMQPISCNGMQNATITVQPTGGVEPYVYNWNAATRSTNNLDSLGPGDYAVTVVDANGCQDASELKITEPDPLIIETWWADIDCFGATTGEIELSIEGGVSPYNILWEDNDQITTPYRNQVVAGDYRAYIEDDLGCTKEVNITIHQPPFNQTCGTFIPNVFSPNEDGLNDAFYVVSSLTSARMESMQIYNRWGELVFENEENCKEVGNAACGWNGYYKNRPAPVGVYVYVIVLETAFQSESILYSGDVTLTK